MTAVRHLLVAYDGSEPAKVALTRAAQMTEPGDTLSVVNVMPEPGVSARLEPPKGLGHQAELLEEAARLLAGHGVRARLVGAVGGAAHEILVAAERDGVDTVILARRSGRGAHVLGSVSSRVVRHARCDVLVVHGAPNRSSG